MKVKSKALLGQISDMDLRLLRVFRTVADCGGMAAAELELNIGISTVSRHIKDLETRLGLTLCRRGRGGFALTPEGEQIYEQTTRLLAATDEFRSQVDTIHQRMGGQLNVAMFDKTATNSESHIADAIGDFVRQAPDVQLNLHVGSLTSIERGVLDGQFQVGIVPGHRSSELLNYERLFGERMHLYCGSAHQLYRKAVQNMQWKGLRDFRFAGLGYHSPNMELSQRERLRRSATASDQEAIANLILSGEFVGFLPDHYASGFVHLGQMRAINPTNLYYDCEFFAITRRSPHPGRAAEAFQECLSRAHNNSQGLPASSGGRLSNPNR